MKNQKVNIDRAIKRNLQYREELLDYWSNYHKEIYSNDLDYKQKRIDFANQQREDGYQSQYRRDNPEKCRQYSLLHRIHDVSKSEEKSMLKTFDYSCAYCGMTLEEHKKKYHEKLHNDHVDDEGYNDLRNDVPACKGCNCSKHTEDMETWFRRQTFFSEDKLNKIIWWISDGYKKYIEDKPPYKITRKQNKGLKTYHWELWAVDEKRNMIECIYEGLKKKDITEFIREVIIKKEYEKIIL